MDLQDSILPAPMVLKKSYTVAGQVLDVIHCPRSFPLHSKPQGTRRRLTCSAQELANGKPMNNESNLETNHWTSSVFVISRKTIDWIELTSPTCIAPAPSPMALVHSAREKEMDHPEMAVMAQTRPVWDCQDGRPIPIS